MGNDERQKRSFLNFSQSEKRGFFLLLAILTAAIAVILIKPAWIRQKTENYDFSEYEKSVARYKAEIEETYEPHNYRNFDYNSPNRSAVRKLKPFAFDPNTLPVDGWMKMGYSEKQANALDNYRKKGGVFRKKEDLKKIFFISDNDYAQLEKYIEIHSENIPQETRNSTFQKFERPENVKKIELNSADTSDLKQLRGIGSGYAKRIVKYREQLGGFCRSEQLLEIYGFSQELYEKVAPNIIIDPENVRKINLNTATLDQLKRHPYLDYYQAKAIVKYREAGNRFTAVSDLLKVNLIYDDTFEKLKPYLSVQ